MSGCQSHGCGSVHHGPGSSVLSSKKSAAEYEYRIELKIWSLLELRIGFLVKHVTFEYNFWTKIEIFSENQHTAFLYHRNLLPSKFVSKNHNFVQKF